MINNCTFMGRITRDLELNRSTNGTPCLSFDLAVNRPMDREKTDYIHCSAYGKTAENIANYFVKGSLIGLTGVMTTQTYTSKKTNSEVSKNILLIQTFSFTGEPAVQQSNSGNNSNQGNQNYQNQNNKGNNGRQGYQNDKNNYQNNIQKNQNYQNQQNNNGNQGYNQNNYEDNFYPSDYEIEDLPWF